MSTYSCFFSVALANKTANTIANVANRQLGYSRFCSCFFLFLPVISSHLVCVLCRPVLFLRPPNFEAGFLFFVYYMAVATMYSHVHMFKMHLNVCVCVCVCVCVLEWLCGNGAVLSLPPCPFALYEIIFILFVYNICNFIVRIIIYCLWIVYMHREWCQLS